MERTEQSRGLNVALGWFARSKPLLCYVQTRNGVFVRMFMQMVNKNAIFYEVRQYEKTSPPPYT